MILDAGSGENIDEEECFYRNNKNAKNNLECAGQELTDLISLYIEDEAEPSETEIKRGIEKILERTHHEGKQNNITERNIKKKISLKVLFVAAILSLLSVCCVGVVGTDNDIKVKNSFVTFDGNVVHIMFFDESDEMYISVKTLLLDLKNKGFGDVAFVEQVVGMKEDGKITLPRYDNTDAKHVNFEFISDEIQYSFDIRKLEASEAAVTLDINSAEMSTVMGVDIYINRSGNETEIQFIHNGLHYIVVTNDSYEEIVRAAEIVYEGDYNYETNYKD